MLNLLQKEKVIIISKNTASTCIYLMLFAYAVVLMSKVYFHYAPITEGNFNLLQGVSMGASAVYLFCLVFGVIGLTLKKIHSEISRKDIILIVLLVIPMILVLY